MKITAQLDYKSYSKLMASQFYKKFLVICTIIFGVLCLLITVVGIVYLEFGLAHILNYGLSGLLVLLMPYVAVKLKSRRGFDSNKMMQEQIIYEFTSDTIIMTGATFKSEMEWSKVHKVKELKDWFLIYQSKHLMNIIPKKDLDEKVPEFINLITSQKGLIYRLLKK